MNTPFVVWTTSGLENPLYVLLLCLILRFSLKSALQERKGLRLAASLGLLAAATALTRPDGLLFAPVYPIVLAMADVTRSRDNRDVASTSRRLVAYAVSFVTLFGAFILFRLLYFGELHPNTYYAKDGPVGADVIALVTLKATVWSRLSEVLGSVADERMMVAVAVLLPLLTWHAVKSRNLSEMAVAALAWTAGLIVLLLPADWMAEHRFATPFVVFFYVLLVLGGGSMLHGLVGETRAGMLVAVLAAGLLIVNAGQFASRSLAFSDNPTLSLDAVRERFGERFNEYAMIAGLENGSILLPDLGGTLLYSDLRVYDLAGLTDKTIARTVQDNQEGFYDYIFEVVKPSFIHSHEWWAYRAHFDQDTRFRGDYVAICEDVDTWVLTRTGEVIDSGDYVRKDVLNSQSALMSMRELC